MFLSALPIVPGSGCRGGGPRDRVGAGARLGGIVGWRSWVLAELCGRIWVYGVGRVDWVWEVEGEALGAVRKVEDCLGGTEANLL